MSKATHFMNRKLTELEQKFRDNYQCIACGVKLKVTPKFKKVDGKSVKVGEIWPFECKECAKLGNRADQIADLLATNGI